VNPQCEPPQFGLHVDSPVLIMDSNRNKILSPGSVSTPSIDLILRSPGEWLQEAGGAVQRGRLAGSQLTSNRSIRTQLHLGLVQCMDASLQKHHQSRTQDSISNYIRHRPDRETKSTTHLRAGSQLLRGDHRLL